MEVLPRRQKATCSRPLRFRRSRSDVPELDVLVQVAHQFDRKRDPWFHPFELRNELRFRRPCLDTKTTT